MRYISLVFAALLLGCSPLSAEDFFTYDIDYQSFEVGDVLVQRLACGAYCDAISAVTHSPVDHAGLVVKKYGNSKNREGQVIEAWTPWVRIVSIPEYLERNDGAYAQMRLRPEIRSEEVIGAVVEHARSLLFRLYDDQFEPGDDMVYCSELPRLAYLDSVGIEVGKMEKISSFDREIAKEYWKDHFDEGIPWDREIVTPHSLFFSPDFYVVHSDFDFEE